MSSDAERKPPAASPTLQKCKPHNTDYQHSPMQINPQTDDSAAAALTSTIKGTHGATGMIDLDFDENTDAAEVVAAMALLDFDAADGTADGAADKV